MLKFVSGYMERNKKFFDFAVFGVQVAAHLIDFLPPPLPTLRNNTYSSCQFGNRGIYCQVKLTHRILITDVLIRTYAFDILSPISWHGICSS